MDVMSLQSPNLTNLDTNLEPQVPKKHSLVEGTGKHDILVLS